MNSTRLLEEKGVPYRLVELTMAAITVRDVIAHSKTCIDPAEVCKTIILRDKSGSFTAVLLRGADRIDFKKVKKQIGGSRVSLDEFL